MAESLFDIFGDVISRQTLNNVSRQPMSNIENFGKKASTGPFKPNEPIKKIIDKKNLKKSFLSNTGKAVLNTPVRHVFTPGTVNVGSVIYNDYSSMEDVNFEDIEFTKPSYKHDNYHEDMFDYLVLPEVKPNDETPPNTPPPTIRRPSLELICPYQDDFFADDFSLDSIPEDHLGLPDIY